MKKEKSKIDAFEKRIHEIDFLRGFLIILVIMDHLFWNLGHYGGVWGVSWMQGFFYNWYWQGMARQIIQPMALAAFCFVSGISCAFSKSNWKRAIETIIVWAIITAGSNILQATHLFGDRLLRVDFNIIGVLGFSMLFYCLLEKRSWKALVAAIAFAFLASRYFIPDLATHLYENGISPVTITRAGKTVTVPNFYMPIFWEPTGQADFVPLFPYVIFFFGGAVLARFIYKERKSIIKHKGNWERPVCFLGRHTLIIYITHEFVLMGIFALLDVIIGG